MEGTLLLCSKRCNFIAGDDSLDYTIIGKTGQATCIKYKNILKVKTQQLAGKDDYCLEIWYAHKPSPIKWQLKQLLLQQHKDSSTNIEKWAAHLQAKIQDFPRPKSLLVIVNPTSGNKNGRSVYKKVSKIWQSLDIQLDVLFTERGGHAVEYISSYNLSKIDGIVCIGGDGTYAECVQGMMTQLQKEAGVDPNDPEAKLVASNIPIGVIPAGTGNGMAECLVGQADVESSALHVAIGTVMPSNIMTVHADGKMLRYSILLTAYSLFSDAVAHSEAKRWMGKFKYVWGLGKMFVDMNTVDAKVEVKVNDDWIQRSGCFLGIIVFASEAFMPHGKLQDDGENATPKLSEDVSSSKLQEDEDKTDAVDGDCTGQSGFFFGLVKPMTRMNLVNYMKRMFQLEVDHPSIKPQVENFPKVSAVRVEHLPSPDGKELEDRVHNLNIDGDLYRIEKPAYEVRQHQDILKLYCAKEEK